jgi:hypothetical protein
MNRELGLNLDADYSENRARFDTYESKLNE